MQVNRAQHYADPGEDGKGAESRMGVATLEPMLYNVPMLKLFTTILNDGVSEHKEDLEALCSLSRCDSRA